MGDFFKKLIEQFGALWGRWTLIQRLILGGIVAASIVAIVVMVSVSSGPGMIPVIDTPVVNEDQRAAIVTRINA